MIFIVNVFCINLMHSVLYGTFSPVNTKFFMFVCERCMK